jgi:hypothetical protein
MAGGPEYAELHCHSCYSLLDGASQPEELVAQASALGLRALALTDHDGLYIAPTFCRMAEVAGLQPIVGAELTLEVARGEGRGASGEGRVSSEGQEAPDGQQGAASDASKTDGGQQPASGRDKSRPYSTQHLTLLAADEQGYRNLCRLLSLAQASRPKGEAALAPARLAAHSAGLIALSGCREGPVAAPLLAGQPGAARAAASWLREVFGPDRCWIELQRHYLPGERRLIRAQMDLARELGLGVVATNNVHYHVRARHRLQDVLVSIRHRTPLDAAHHLRRPNAEYYLKDAATMARLFAEVPAAVRNTLAIAEQCQARVQLTAYRFPDFPLPPGETADSFLAARCREGALARYGHADGEVGDKLRYELDLIQRHGLAGYFLIVWDLMEFARRERIPAQGRGSAANSIVAYVLGLTNVDPIRHKLFVGRFLNEELSTLPDIDIDFSREHREQVLQYVYTRYGREHAALVSTHITYQARSAVRDVGKALGLPLDALDRLARQIERMHFRPDPSPRPPPPQGEGERTCPQRATRNTRTSRLSGGEGGRPHPRPSPRGRGSWRRSVDAADFDDVVAGPAGGEDLVAGVGNEDHLFEADAAVAGAALARLDGDDVAGLDLLRVVEGEGAADDGLLVGHADAVADLGDEEALLGLVAPGAGGQKVARGVGGAGAGLDLVDDGVDAVAAAGVPVALLGGGLAAHDVGAVDADFVAVVGAGAGVGVEEVADLDHAVGVADVVDLEGVGAGADAAGDDLAAGLEHGAVDGGADVALAHAGARDLADGGEAAVGDGDGEAQAVDLVVGLDAAGLEHGGHGAGELDAGFGEGLAAGLVDAVGADLVAVDAALLEVADDGGGEAAGLFLDGGGAGDAVEPAVGEAPVLGLDPGGVDLLAFEDVAELVHDGVLLGEDEGVAELGGEEGAAQGGGVADVLGAGEDGGGEAGVFEGGLGLGEAVGAQAAVVDALLEVDGADAIGQLVHRVLPLGCAAREPPRGLIIDRRGAGTNLVGDEGEGRGCGAGSGGWGKGAKGATARSKGATRLPNTGVKGAKGAN